MEQRHQHPLTRILFATAQPPELGPGPRTGVTDLAVLQGQLNGELADSNLKQEVLPLVRALTLLWHDHLESSHELSQHIHDADGSYVHGIMHRREPDYGNAAYWFRKVGNHPAFEELAQRVSRLLDDRKDTALASRLMPRGRWDPFAYIDACEAAKRNRNDEAPANLLREFQAIEFEVLLARFLA